MQNRFAVYRLLASFEVELGVIWYSNFDSEAFEVHFHLLVLLGLSSFEYLLRRPFRLDVPIRQELRIIIIGDTNAACLTLVGMPSWTSGGPS